MPPPRCLLPRASSDTPLLTAAASEFSERHDSVEASLFLDCVTAKLEKEKRDVQKLNSSERRLAGRLWFPKWDSPRSRPR